MKLYASPWKLFVPDFVWTSITAPPARPNSAEYVLVSTWNSLIVLMLTFWRFWFSDESSLLTPSIWNVAERVPVPLKFTELPLDAVGLFWPLTRLTWKPANVSTRLRKLRPASGRLWTRVESSVPLTSPPTVSISGTSPVTFTTSATAAAGSAKSDVVVVFSATSTDVFLSDMNPWAF